MNARLVMVALCAALAVVGTHAGDAGNPAGSVPPPVEIVSDPQAAATRSRSAGGVALPMRWRLTGFLGFLAGLFVPNDGDALLTVDPAPADRTRIEILITAPGRHGEYYLYGAEVDSASGAAALIWSSYAFRKEAETKAARIDDPSVLDFASAVYLLNKHPPKRTAVWSIWNRGKLYAAEIEPLGPDVRKIGDTRVAVRGYAVRGANVPGRKSFDEKIQFYFADDDEGRPVEIVATRGLIHLRMQAVDP